MNPTAFAGPRTGYCAGSSRASCIDLQVGGGYVSRLGPRSGLDGETIMRGRLRRSVVGLVAILLMGMMVATAFGQDPTKVEPKHYKLDFENDRVQVVSVHYGPHEKSQMHEHPGGVVVVVTSGHLKFTDENGKVTEVFAKAGEARWFAPFKHTVENVGDTAYNAVYVGMRGGKNVISNQVEDKEVLEAVARAVAGK